jgi:aquaporin Z
VPMLETLRKHWPEYAIEAWALGVFMVSAGVFTVLVEHPDFPIRSTVDSDFARRVLIGMAMGATAIALIYSPWGRRSGAHMNPAVTLTFFSLRKIARWDAVFFIAAQFVGGLLGVLFTLLLFGDRFADAPVSYVTTLPGPNGATLAFGLEALISCGLMTAVLTLSNSTRLMSCTGLVAGFLVAAYIAFEAPYSGMSMNPARSFASAAPAGLWQDLWIYFVAPALGMLLAGLVYSRTHMRVHCAKLYHASDTRCIHCGYEPRILRGRSYEDESIDWNV